VNKAVIGLVIFVSFLAGYLIGAVSMLLLPEPDILDCITEAECAMDQAVGMAKLQRPARIAL